MFAEGVKLTLSTESTLQGLVEFPPPPPILVRLTQWTQRLCMFSHAAVALQQQSPLSKRHGASAQGHSGRLTLGSWWHHSGAHHGFIIIFNIIE